MARPFPLFRSRVRRSKWSFARVRSSTLDPSLSATLSRRYRATRHRSIYQSRAGIRAILAHSAARTRVRTSRTSSPELHRAAPLQRRPVLRSVPRLSRVRPGVQRVRASRETALTGAREGGGERSKSRTIPPAVSPRPVIPADVVSRDRIPFTPRRDGHRRRDLSQGLERPGTGL